jgi:hypothetical protein
MNFFKTKIYFFKAKSINFFKPKLSASKQNCLLQNQNWFTSFDVILECLFLWGRVHPWYSFFWLRLHPWMFYPCDSDFILECFILVTQIASLNDCSAQNLSMVVSNRFVLVTQTSSLNAFFFPCDSDFIRESCFSSLWLRLHPWTIAPRRIFPWWLLIASCIFVVYVCVYIYVLHTCTSVESFHGASCVCVVYMYVYIHMCCKHVHV